MNLIKEYQRKLEEIKQMVEQKNHELSDIESRLSQAKSEEFKSKQVKDGHDIQIEDKWVKILQFAKDLERLKEHSVQVQNDYLIKSKDLMGYLDNLRELKEELEEDFKIQKDKKENIKFLDVTIDRKQDELTNLKTEYADILIKKTEQEKKYNQFLDYEYNINNELDKKIAYLDEKQTNLEKQEREIDVKLRRMQKYEEIINSEVFNEVYNQVKTVNSEKNKKFGELKDMIRGMTMEEGLKVLKKHLKSNKDDVVVQEMIDEIQKNL